MNDSMMVPVGANGGETALGGVGDVGAGVVEMVGRGDGGLSSKIHSFREFYKGREK